MLRLLVLQAGKHRPPPSQRLLQVAWRGIATTTTSSSSSTSSAETIHPSIPPAVVDFSDTQTAYSSLSTTDLLRAYLVFKACAIKPLVAHADQVLNTSYRLLGTTLTEAIVRHTFFRHFCAGETAKTIRPRVEKLQKSGVAGILDYAAEADIEQMTANPEQEATTQAYKEGDIACRVYSYESERQCDAHVQTFLECIHAVKDVTPEGFAAIKVTALGNPQLLERMSTCLLEVRRLFTKFDTAGKGYITRAQFKEGYDKYFLPANGAEGGGHAVERLLVRLDPQGKDKIDYIEWSTTLGLEDVGGLTQHCRATGPLKQAVLSEEEKRLMLAMKARLDVLARRAASLGVRLMIDAEQSFFQPAIDSLVLELMEKHNRERFVVYTTIQCYLKDASTRLQDDMDRAKRQGYYFAAKLVRGAYMVTERKRAVELGYESPIHETIAATHATYDGCVEKMLVTMAQGNKVEVLIASHNQTSIEKALGSMARLGLEQQKVGVYFGQLLGMADHLTLTLGKRQYKAFKYVPYGLVGQVLPYLIRRAQENSDVMGGVGTEMGLLRKELRRRMTARLPF